MSTGSTVTAAAVLDALDCEFPNRDGMTLRPAHAPNIVFDLAAREVVALVDDLPVGVSARLLRTGLDAVERFAAMGCHPQAARVL